MQAVVRCYNEGEDRIAAVSERLARYYGLRSTMLCDNPNRTFSYDIASQVCYTSNLKQDRRKTWLWLVSALEFGTSSGLLLIDCDTELRPGLDIDLKQGFDIKATFVRHDFWTTALCVMSPLACSRLANLLRRVQPYASLHHGRNGQSGAADLLINKYARYCKINVCALENVKVLWQASEQEIHSALADRNYLAITNVLG